MEINKPISSVLMIVVIIIMVALFIIPQYQISQQATMELNQMQAESFGQSLYDKNIADLDAQIKTRKDSLAKITMAMPGDVSIAPLSYFFQKKAQENNVTITALGFSQSSSDGFSDQQKSLMLSLSITGSYEGGKAFLAAIENSARLFNVSTLSLSALPIQKNQVQNYEMKLELIIHT